MEKVILRTLTLCVAMIAVGCQDNGGSDPNRPKTYPVTGTVKLNGKAVEGAVVTFHATAGSQTSIGSTDANGGYSLTTFQSGDGAPAGQYDVSVIKYESGAAPSSGPPAGTMTSGDLPADYAPPTAGSGQGVGPTGPKNVFPEKYGNPKTSALRATVSESGENKIDFDLK
jgi:hypothetical protein